jgi:D-alanyl-lipoteichoic acid acyltransferase DltB (MBOAT superfamily)
LHHQIFANHKLSYANLSNGFRLVIYGLFVKMVIADNLAPLVDLVFSNPLAYSQFDNLLGLLFFSLQIYADFSGYSLIAIGVALAMGVNLMDNFKTPYFATTVKAFWSRWHISLSTWFRDYLYIPLGGNKVAYFRWLLNILIVFIVSGIWHGANFTFIIWGLIHGIAYLIENVITLKQKSKNYIFTFASWLKTYVIISIAWVFFRSDTLASAYLSVSRIIGNNPTLNSYLAVTKLEKSNPTDISLNYFNTYSDALIKSLEIKPVYFCLIIMLIIFDLWIKQSRFDKRMATYPFAVRWLIYALLIFCIMTLSGSEFYQFIYFQF